MNEPESDINLMSFDDLKIYCNQIVIQNTELKKQIIEMNKLINLLNANKLLTLFNQIKNDANFGITLLENHNEIKSNKYLKNSELEEEKNKSDNFLTEEETNGSGDESFGNFPEKYFEQNLEESKSDEDSDWEPLKKQKRRIPLKPLKTVTKRSQKQTLYNPSERIHKNQNVKIGNKEFECLMADDGNFHCEWADCKEVFSSRGDVMRHYETHGAQKQFICHYPNCERKLASRSTYNQHLLVHSGVKPYECDWPECEYRCNDRTSLRVHKRSHTGEKPHWCDWPGCNMSFISSSRLYDHRRTHTGEKPFSCDWPECTYSAGRYQEVKKHKNRVHLHLMDLGGKSFACDWPECKFKTNVKAELNKHVRIKHMGEKALKCDFLGCHFETGYHSVMSKHKRLKH